MALGVAYLYAQYAKGAIHVASQDDQEEFAVALWALMGYTDTAYVPLDVWGTNDYLRYLLGRDTREYWMATYDAGHRYDEI